MKRWLAFAPLAALLIVVAIAVVLLTRSEPREMFSSGSPGRPVPEFSLTRLDGGPPVSNETMRGRVYVINMFASWCTPCRAEHPLLMALKADGVEIVGVAYKDAPGATARFLNELGDPYAAVVLDEAGQFGLDLGIAGVPETFVVSADGSIQSVHRGPLTPEVIETSILPALRR